MINVAPKNFPPNMNGNHECILPYVFECFIHCNELYTCATILKYTIDTFLGPKVIPIILVNTIIMWSNVFREPTSSIFTGGVGLGLGMTAAY